MAKCDQVTPGLIAFLDMLAFQVPEIARDLEILEYALQNPRSYWYSVLFCS